VLKNLIEKKDDEIGMLKAGIKKFNPQLLNMV